MADYSNSCKCGRYQHAEWCTSHHNYKKWSEAQGVKRQAVELRRSQGYNLLSWIGGLWACTRCGNVVWNPDLHSQFFAEHPDTQHPADKIKGKILNG